MREKEILVIAEDLNGHVESNSENYDDQHGDKKERRNESWVLCNYEHGIREYTLQKESKSPSHLWVWYI